MGRRNLPSYITVKNVRLLFVTKRHFLKTKLSQCGKTHKSEVLDDKNKTMGFILSRGRRCTVDIVIL